MILQKSLRNIYNNRELLTAMQPNFDNIAEGITYEAKAKNCMIYIKI